MRKFTERSLAADLEKKMVSQHRALEEDLLEIYEDENGQVIDVKKINIKQRNLFWPVFWRVILILITLGVIGFGTYYYFFQFKRGGAGLMALAIDAPKEVAVGDEFNYIIRYRNDSPGTLSNLRFEATLPDNFIVLQTLPEADANHNSWTLRELAKGESGEIRVKGILINTEGSNNVMEVNCHYNLLNFSLEFKNSALGSVAIKGVGAEMELNYPSSVLGGETEKVILKLRNPNFDTFKLTASSSQAFSIVGVDGKGFEGEQNIQIDKLSDNTWNLSGLNSDFNYSLALVFKAIASSPNPEPIDMLLQRRASDNELYAFYQKTMPIQILEGDMLLSLAINGEKGDQAINFGDRLQYSIVYANRGKSPILNAAIMAIVKSEFVNWDSLKDNNLGERRNDALVWTKDQIPGLADLEPGATGEIVFTLNASQFKTNDLGKEAVVESYARYYVGGEDTASSSPEDKSRSNVIVSKINSDLKFNEQIRYFDVDNNPVGLGPLPPKALETTSFRVTWNLQNSLHELNDVTIEMPLPDHLSMGATIKATIGEVNYNADSQSIIWTISKMPVSVYNATAEFNLVLTPQSDDVGRIMVLSPGSILKAYDTATQSYINLSAAAQTTKLNDDDIAALTNNGIIR